MPYRHHISGSKMNNGHWRLLLQCGKHSLNSRFELAQSSGKFEFARMQVLYAGDWRSDCAKIRIHLNVGACGCGRWFELTRMRKENSYGWFEFRKREGEIAREIWIRSHAEACGRAGDLNLLEYGRNLLCVWRLSISGSKMINGHLQLLLRCGKHSLN